MRRANGDGLSRRLEAALKSGSVVGFKGREVCREELPLRYDDDVESWRNVIVTKNLSYQSFSAISSHRAAEFLCRRDAQPTRTEPVGPNKQRAVAAVNARATLVSVLKIRVAAYTLAWTKSQRYSLLTVSRLRPFARRRFSTSLPFFVLMRTRNP